MNPHSPFPEHIIRVNAVGRRPACWRIAEHLWGENCNVDSDGDSRSQDDEKWTELTLLLRGQSDQRVDVDPVADEPSFLEVRSTNRALAEKVAAFISGAGQ